MLPITHVIIWYKNYLLSNWRFRFISSTFIFNALLEVPLIFPFFFVLNDLPSVSPGRQKAIYHTPLKYKIKCQTTEQISFLIENMQTAWNNKRNLPSGGNLLLCFSGQQLQQFWILWCHCSVKTFILFGASYIDHFFALFGKWFKHCL